MCLFKTRKQIKELTKVTNELKDIVKNEELVKLRVSKERLDHIEKNIKDLETKFKIKSVKKLENQETGNLFLKIEYQPLTINLEFDSDNNVIENKMFKSINELNLISIEDMAKLSEKIGEIQENGNEIK